jgi:hypothetical protein
LLVAFKWLFEVRRFRAQLLMVMRLAVLVGSSLLVKLVIDHPFSGDVDVSSSPFQLGVLARFWYGGRVPRVMLVSPNAWLRRRTSVARPVRGARGLALALVDTAPLAQLTRLGRPDPGSAGKPERPEGR